MAKKKKSREVETGGLELGRRWRALLASIGVGFLIAGAVAVFLSTNGAGTVALIGMGAVLLALAAGGMLPNWVKLGDYEFAFRLWRKAQMAEEQGRPDEAEELLEAARDVAQGVPVTPPAPDYEKYVDAALRAAAPDAQREAQPPSRAPAGVDGTRPDFLLELGGVRIAVEAKTKIKRRFMRQVLGLGQLPYDAALIIGADLSQHASEFLPTFQQEAPIPVEVLKWRPGDSAELIARTLDRLSRTAKERREGTLG